MKRKRNPIEDVRVMVFCLGVLLVALLIAGFVEREKQDRLLITFMVLTMLLFFSMSRVSAAIKHMVSRIDELEKKLETRQTGEAV
jgi:nitrate/nitrite transporter NarK